MKKEETNAFQAADLLVDAGQRRVWQAGQEIILPKRSFDLLIALVRAAPDSLSIDELIDEVWNGAIVSPATVAKRVELLRHALGDSSDDARYIALVRGHGYRLIPPVTKPADKPVSPTRAGVIASAAALLVVIAIAWFAFRTDPGPIDESVAVLPFATVSGDAEDERFADGLTEELIHALTRTGGFRVAGRTSSFYYKDRRESLRDIGDSLNVAHLLEGSVRRNGNQLRVTAQLVDAGDGFQLWSEVYDRPVNDVLQIQQDIARSVSTRLRSSVLPASTLGRTRTSSDPEAYALYLKAVSLSPYPFGIDPPAAQALLERVVEMDPGFAAAWTLLAAVHGRRIVARDPTYPLTARDGVSFIYEALDTAKELDPELGEIYATLGGLAWAVEYDPIKAAPLIEKALELDPWNLNIIAFAANFATYIGRYEEALALEELLVARDPLCDTCRFQLAQSYEYTGRFSEMERELLTLKAMGRAGLDWHLAVANLYQGHPEDALTLLPTAGNDSLRQQLIRAMALHDLEERRQSVELLADAADRWGTRPPLELAQAYSYVGNLDSAFTWLNALVSSDPQPLYFRYPSPLFDNLRGDPRWQILMERLGLSPENLATVPFKLNTILQQTADGALDRE